MPPNARPTSSSSLPTTSPHPYQHLERAGNDGKAGRYVTEQIGLSLFDLGKDIGETTNVAEQNVEVVKRLMICVERARDDLGDALVKREGKNVRLAGQLDAEK